MTKELSDRVPDRDTIILIEEPITDYQCTMCGYVVTMKRRPGYCPDCNCVDGDMDNYPLQRLFISRASCGWFE